jgi:predicted SnoaL-like aldol condensation-catalyzing enzyme
VTAPTVQTHPHVQVLRTVYGDGDLRRLDQYASDDIILHRADREPSVSGKPAVLAYERRTAAANRVMNVEQIIANDYFGVAMGSITANGAGRELHMPFCGLWRFADGALVEHWENAYDIAALKSFLTESSVARTPETDS